MEKEAAMAQFIMHYDSVIISALARRESKKTACLFFKFLSHFGSGLLYILVGLSELVFLGAEGRQIFLAMLTAFLVQVPAYLIIKKTVKRLRPFEKMSNVQNMIKAPDKYSFPSGHTAAAFVMAGSLSYQFPQFIFLLFSIAVLIGFSRIYLRVHFPTDVLAGSALGLLSAWFGMWLIF